MAGHVARRVSYILPAPSDPPPLLQLPPLGSSRRGHTAPLITYASPDGERGGAVAPNGAGPHAAANENENPFGTPPASPVRRPVSLSQAKHPRHCLGISSLALDTSTVLSGSSAPGGILYTGGRDGLVASWDLHVPHRRRRGARYEHAPGRGGRVKWEKIGDGAEFFEEDEEEGEEADASSSDDEEQQGETPYESRWEVDREALSRSRVRPDCAAMRIQVLRVSADRVQPAQTAYRQSAQTHTDWVNAMLLCNLNQTVITASADRTIRAWTPHASAERLFPTLVGRHKDYVRSLAWARHPSLLFSGALDRQIAIWDIQGGTSETPVLTIDMEKVDDWGGVGPGTDRGSVYGLAVDPAASILAAGTPESIVRLWDPRAGDKSIGKLIGHSDTVRSLLISDDGRYILTGGSDKTIKLWHSGEHRVIHTFNHHDASVWALHSDHPNLERFYSGSRDGMLCVVDVERCTDMSDGECVVLAREGNMPPNGEYMSKSGDEGIRSIVSMDDEYVWTATGSADVKRWRDVGRRVSRLDSDYDGASYNRRGSDIDGASGVPRLQRGFTPTPITANARRSLDGESAPNPLIRTESRESRSVAFGATPSPRNGPVQRDDGAASQSVSFSPSALSSNIRDRLGISGQRKPSSTSLANSADASDSDDEGEAARPSATLNGLPYESLVCLAVPDTPYGFSGQTTRSDDGHTLRSGAASISSAHGGLGVQGAVTDESHGRRRPSADQAKLEFEDREVSSEATPLRAGPDEVIAGRPGLVRSLILNDRQHVLTVDTEGEVAVWNIIRGQCVGRYSSAEVAKELDLERGVSAEKAVRKHSNEVLELVKERIEGETMVITWCGVDTKIGSLVVHLEEGRVFDAEVYADELGLLGQDGINLESRINLGKWALANLFKGLIKAEEREVTMSTPTSTTASLPSISRSPAPTHISIERPNAAPPHRQRAMSGSLVAPGTPSLNIPGLATPALTPALVPDDSHLSRSAPVAASGWQSFQALRSGPLSAIAQSPSTASPGAGPGSADYFSLHRKSEPSPDRGGQPQTPGAVAQTPAVPQTPGGSGLKSKFKFGKKKTLDTPMTTVPESKPAEAAEPEDKVSLVYSRKIRD